MQIHGHAYVIGDDVHAIADRELTPGVGKIDEAVLLIHFVEPCAGASTIWPNVTSADAGRSDENVLDPPSMIIWPGRAVETTVARMDAAQSSMAQPPLRTVLSR